MHEYDYITSGIAMASVMTGDVVLQQGLVGR